MKQLEALGFEWKLRRHGHHRNMVAWDAQLAKLAAYKAERGDCCVPEGWAQDPKLATWVHMQREANKALDRGDPRSKITAAVRMARLDALGFAWSMQSDRELAWEQSYTQQASYKAKHGDCNVPRDWTDDPRLGRWVGRQRQAKTRLDRELCTPGPWQRGWRDLTR
jgi:hypothetical protein